MAQKQVYFEQVENKSKVKQDTLEILKNPFLNIPTIEKSLEISKEYKIALHPRYTLYWNEFPPNQLIDILTSLKSAQVNKKSIIITTSPAIKKFYENLAVEHQLISEDSTQSIIEIQEHNSKIIQANIGITQNNWFNKSSFELRINELVKESKLNLTKTSLEIINLTNFIEIRDKGGTYIGCRMGRPEKAKMREFDGRPAGLFPIAQEGGRMRNIMEAVKKTGKITSNYCFFMCPKCDKETIYPRCQICKAKTEKMYFERFTDFEVNKDHEKAVRWKKADLELKTYIDEVRDILKDVNLPKSLKGIEKTENRFRITEHLSKLFLRERNKVYVNKDGTSRFDMIEMGITHFKPHECGTSVEILKTLGYKKDYLGEELIRDNQILEILPQDVILPDCTASGDELASDYVIRTANFVDDELINLYEGKAFYNFKTKEDTIGHLIIGLAPHTSSGIIGRIIGYTKTQGCFSHPVWHAAQRRNLDGDENGIMMLMDGLLNFSREYLPDRRGSRTMDTSLVLTAHLYLDQIDDEVHGMDIVDHYPLSFYRACKDYISPKSVEIEQVENRLKIEDYDTRYLGYGFTHSNNDLNDTVLCSSYKYAPSMQEKMDLQLLIGTQIRAVDEHKVGTFIIDKHFMKDIKGNLRKFSMQKFRCTKCNISYRRPPLNGKCTQCLEPNINFTIHEGSIKKYLGPSFDICKKYNVDPYIVETLELANLRVEGVFGKVIEKQKSLSSFFGK
jgi:DNA polymerase II large subunit